VENSFFAGKSTVYDRETISFLAALNLHRFESVLFEAKR
jgi:hypothetical protein